MDNWILKSAKTLVNEPSSLNALSPTQIKVKVSHLLLTDYDAMLFSGAIATSYPRVIGRAATGIVTEAGENCYGVEKGTRVYFEPARNCGQCLSCRSGKSKNCTDVLSAGKDFDGFMRDFVICEYTDVTPLPDSVSDIYALCIEPIGTAENIYDQLNLSAGQRVAVVGADFMGNIIAQVLQYHKIVPIVIDNHPANLERTKSCGIFHAFAADNDLDAAIINATSGTMCDAAVYCSSSRLPINVATRLVGVGKKIVLSSPSTFSSPIDARDILEKDLTVFGVSNAYDYTQTVINMLVHSAVNIDIFEKRVLTEYDPASLLTEICGNTTGTNGNLTILKMVL